jgi:DNA-binding MarR family transcriptional regulator
LICQGVALVEHGSEETEDGSALGERELAAWRGFLRAHARTVRELDAELQERAGLPLSSYEVLVSLRDAPDHRLRMSEVASHLLLTAGGVTRLVDRLVGAGLVAKEPCLDDRRGSYAVLTPVGAERLRAARTVHLAGVRRRFLSRLSAQEVEQLARIWERVDPAPA